MSGPIDEVRAQLLRSVFQMPSVQTMVSRKSSITNAFVCAIVPVVEPSVEEIAEALAILGMVPQDLRCAYCGDRYTEWDHLRPLVKDRRPTGFISEIGNLVPSCGKCNQSKGNKAWETWIRGERAKWSPRRRGVQDLEAKIERLRAYERWRPPVPVDLERIVGAAAWADYWRRLEAMDQTLLDCQAAAKKLAEKIAAAQHATKRVIPGVNAEQAS